MPDRDRAFREFFDQEFRSLKRLAFLLTSDWDQAEDLAQEAMVRTYRAWHRIYRRKRPGAYARTVLVNRHRSLLRRAKVEAKHIVARTHDPVQAPEGMDEDQLVVWNALKELPPRERQVLVLRYYEDLPQSEIAGLLQIPVGTVKSVTHRAIGRLRETLGEDFEMTMSESA